MVSRLLCSLLACLLAQFVYAQGGRTAPPPTDTTAASPVEIDFAEVYTRTVVGAVDIQRLIGQVELHQDSIYIYCDEATIVNERYVKAVGNVSIRQNDTISTFADSVTYYADSLLAYLYGDVALVNGGQQLFTDSLRYDLATKQARYVSRAKLTDGSAQLSSIRGTYDVERAYANFRDSVFVVGDDFNLLADTLGFDTREKIVYFEGPTLMATPQSRVYCEDGFYRLADTTGVFVGDAQVTRGTQRARADTILYFGTADRFELSGRARFVDGLQRAQGRRIVYDERANATTLTGDASFQQGEQRVQGERIFYDGAAQAFRAVGRVDISEPPYLLQADSLWHDERTGIAFVEGDVVWRDTASQRSISAQRVEYRKVGDYVKAYGGRPVFVSVVDADSLYMSADTLLTFLRPSGLVAAAPLPDTASTEGSSRADSASAIAVRSLPDTTGVLSDSTTALPDSSASAIAPADSVRMLLAYRDVRIYKSNLQAVCDSIAYDGVDSAFTLFRAPVLWSDTSQFTADTIVIRLRDANIDAVSLRSSALIVNSPDEQFFNQIKGRRVDAFFRDGAVARMNVNGNAESVYYLLDDARAYLGVNHVRSARMRILFEDSELSDIYFYDRPEGDLTPLEQVGEQPELLEGFRWDTEHRPRSPEDLR